jgi:hypothetical protein
MKGGLKCENTSPTYKRLKCKPTVYNGQRYEVLLEVNGISHMVKVNSKNLPYGVIEKIETFNIKTEQ